MGLLAYFSSQLTDFYDNYCREFTLVNIEIQKDEKQINFNASNCRL